MKLDPREMRGRLDLRDNFDDKPGAVNKRIETFQMKTLPVLEKYKYKARLALFWPIFSNIKMYHFTFLRNAPTRSVKCKCECFYLGCCVGGFFFKIY